MNVQGVLHTIDGISTWVGKAFAWLIVLLMGVVCIEVFKRYLMNAPTAWIFDAENMLYGTCFMLGGAYALSRGQHVRGDIFYRNWPVKVQGAVDLFLYIFAFFPGIVALISVGAQWAGQSWAIHERSFTSEAAPPLYPLKTVIPIAGPLMAIQGVAETIRSFVALRTGVWPPRLSDVEETETILAKQSEV